MTGILRLLWPGGWIRWVIIGVVIVAVVVVVLLFLFLREISRPGEATAEFFPSNTMAYASINLRPGVGQIDKAIEFGDLLRTDEFTDEEEDLLDDVEEETGIHPLDDVTSWLGTDISFAILDVDEDEGLVEWVLMAQVSDEDEAADFVEKLRDYLEDELYTDFDEDEIGGAEAWIADDEDVAIALTGDYLLVADSEDTIEDMLDNMDSTPDRSLAEDEQFMAAREALPEGRLMFTYLSMEDILDLSDVAVDLVNELGVSDSWIVDNAPEYVAASVSFIDKGVRVDVISDAAISSLSIDSDTDLRSAEVVPEDTLFLLSYAGVTDAWDELRDTLEESDPYAAEDLDEFLEDIEDETGIDVEEDVMESLTGEVALAILPGDVSISTSDGELVGLLQAVFLAGLDDPSGIEDAMEELVELIEDEGYDTGSESIGNYDAVILDMDQFDEDVIEGYEAGYVITDDWLAVGTTVDSLDSFFDAYEGGASSLSSGDKFSGLVDMAPAPLHFLAMADVAGILEMVVDGLDEYDLEDYEEDVQPFVENLSGFMFAGSLTDERWHFTVALTLED